MNNKDDKTDNKVDKANYKVTIVRTTKEWVKEKFQLKVEGENFNRKEIRGVKDNAAKIVTLNKDKEAIQAHNDLEDVGSANKGENRLSINAYHASLNDEKGENRLSCNGNPESNNNDGDDSIKLIPNDK